MTPEELAKIFIKSSELHEASWNNEPEQYTRTIQNAIDQALHIFKVDPRFSFPIYLALGSWGNDCHEWAEEIEKDSWRIKEVS